ncbi:MAG: hypothetical protein ACK4NW_05410 [Roseinatronobacter sp.]
MSGASTDTDADQDAFDDAPVPRPALPQKPASDEALGILREEAAFEAKQRAREAEALESQPELGLLGAAPWPSKPNPAAMEPETVAAGRDSDTRGSSLPDIDDISASLDPIERERGGKGASAETVSVPPTSAERNKSFIRGLTLPLAVALILVVLYLIAPIVGAAVPALSSVTSGYVNAVDGLRATIAGLFGL